MNDSVEARLHPLRKEGDTEVVLLRMPEGSLGGGAAPVYARAIWSYDEPDVMPNDVLSLADRDRTNSLFVGCEIDENDPTRLNFPTGVYLMSVMFSLNVRSTDPTFFIAGLAPNFDESSGWIPDGVYAATGPDSGPNSPIGQPLDPSTDFLQVQWSGLATIPFYVNFKINHDSPDLEGIVDFRLARVAAF